MEKNRINAATLAYTQCHIPSSTLTREVAEIFKKQSGAFIAITEANGVTGLVGREKLQARIGTQFGWVLYADKPVSELMDKSPMVVDGEAAVLDLVRQLVQRTDETFFDDVIVSVQGTFAGLISVKSLMIAQLRNLEEKMLEIEEQRALFARTMATYLVDRTFDGKTFSDKVEAVVDVAQEIERMEQQTIVTSEESVMQGRIEQFSAIDLVQILVQGGKTGCLEMRAGSRVESQVFHIYLVSGKIIHASGAGDEGIESLWKAMRLKSGAFCFYFEKTSSRQTIRENPMTLLLEACRRQDHEMAEVNS